LRLLKENTFEYTPFYKSVKDISEKKERSHYGNLSLLTFEQEAAGINLVEKYSHTIQSIFFFESETANAKDFSELSNVIRTVLKRTLPLKDCSVFLFNDSYASLIPIDKNAEKVFVQNINKIYKEGILNLSFENKKPFLIPDLTTLNGSVAKLNYLIVPFVEEEKKRGILAISTPLQNQQLSSLDYQVIKLIFNQSITKIDKLISKERINRIYNELQTYQAKLANDFRLAAVGELTEGIVEDINTPLQVIMSLSDLLANEDIESSLVDKIKSQINRINLVISRLVKFANLNHTTIDIQPCDLNGLITEYYNMTKSTFQNLNFECLLKLEKDIPSVLSHPSYIVQILANTVSLIKQKADEAVGIIIQTSYEADNIYIKLFNTVELQSYPFTRNIKIQDSSSINFKIIETLIEKHEGSFKIEQSEQGGSVVSIKFPLRRKLRK